MNNAIRRVGSLFLLLLPESMKRAKLQKTRDMLKYVRVIVRGIWDKEENPFIVMPWHVNLLDDRIVRSFFSPPFDSYAKVVEKDIVENTQKFSKPELVKLISTAVLLKTYVYDSPIPLHGFPRLFNIANMIYEPQKFMKNNWNPSDIPEALEEVSSSPNMIFLNEKDGVFWFWRIANVNEQIDSEMERIKREEIPTLRQLGFPEGYYIASIDLAKRDEYIPVLKEIGFDTVIVDEVHNVELNTERENLLRNLVSNAKLNVLFLSATPHRGNSKDYLNRLVLLDPTIESPEDSREFYELTHNVNVFRRGKEVVNEVEGREVFPKCEFNTLAVETTDDEKEYFETLTSFLRYKIREVTEGEEYSPEALLAVLVQKRALSSPKAALRTFESILSGLQKRKRILTPQ